MDTSDLSNLPLSADCLDTREIHPELTDEQNTRANFSGRSATFSTFDQAELQQLPLTYEEQLSQQRVLADFDISLLPSTRDRATSDEHEDSFASLAYYASNAAYQCQLLSFDDDTGLPLDSNLGFFGDINTSGAVLAELEGNDVLQQPEQSQSESDAKGIIIPEGANPDKRSNQRRGPEPGHLLIRGIPKSSIEYSIDMHIQESLRRAERLTERRQKLDSTETKKVPFPQEVVTISHSVAVPEKSANSPENTGQDTDESLRELVEKETKKWIVVRKGIGKRYMCNYPICGFACTRLGDLKKHIFIHTNISIFKCTYPECANFPYFRDMNHLRRHVQTNHRYEQPHYCSLCGRYFRRLYNYKTHMRAKHKMDNDKLSNLPLSKDSADSGKQPLELTAEQNKQASFSRRSATVSTSEQAERQTVDESGDPFVALATYQPLTFDDKRQKLDTTETEIVLLPHTVVTTSQSVAMSEKSANSPKNTGQDISESLSDRVKRETEKYVLRLKDAEDNYKCGYPNCGLTFSKIYNLKTHIFIHIGISRYKCSYPECSFNPYFRTSSSLLWHEESYHKTERSYRCTLCDKRFWHLHSYRRHMYHKHSKAV